jgi:hypothetical protein
MKKEVLVDLLLMNQVDLSMFEDKEQSKFKIQYGNFTINFQKIFNKFYKFYKSHVEPCSLLSSSCKIS